MQPYEEEGLQFKNKLACKKQSFKRGHQILEKFGMTFLKKGQKREMVWFVLFLEHHKSEGMNQEEEGGNNKQQRKTKGNAI